MDLRKVRKKLRGIGAGIAAEPIPPRLARLLEPDRPPPSGGAAGMRASVLADDVDAPIDAVQKTHAVRRSLRASSGTLSNRASCRVDSHIALGLAYFVPSTQSPAILSKRLRAGALQPYMQRARVHPRLVNGVRPAALDHQSAAGAWVSFEETAALGCRIEGEPDLKLTPALILLWYEEAKEAEQCRRL